MAARAENTTTPDSPSLRRYPATVAALTAAFPGAQVRSVLGHGGGGPVLLVDWDGASRAVKCLALQGRPGARRRAEREAATLADLRHPHVVELIDTRAGNGLQFIATEYLPRGVLSDYLAQPFTAADLCAVGVAAGRGLATVQRTGRLFLDVKPRNIGVAADWTPKLLDFGHCKTTETAQRSTFTGGTPDYAPPEAVRPGPIGPWSDVYSLAISLLVLAAGQHHWRCGTYTRLLQTGPPRLPPIQTISRASIPDAVAAVIDSALATDTAARPQGAGDLAALLSGAAATEWGPDWTGSTRWRIHAGRPGHKAATTG